MVKRTIAICLDGETQTDMTIEPNKICKCGHDILHHAYTQRTLEKDNSWCDVNNCRCKKFESQTPQTKPDRVKSDNGRQINVVQEGQPAECNLNFEDDCKNIIERYGKQWDIKPHVLKGTLWWKDAMEDAYEKAIQLTRQKDKEAVEKLIEECKEPNPMTEFSTGINFGLELLEKELDKLFGGKA